VRKLFSFNMMSLDGFFEGPNQSIDWHRVDEEFNDFAVEQLAAIDTILFGRITYLGMLSWWPTPMAIETDPIVAGKMNNIRKVVISTTLDNAEWNNTRLIKDNVAEEVTRLKQQPGGDLALFGSGKLMASLMQLDLIDEHRVMLNPVLLGTGTRLFQTPGEQELRLVQSRPFKNGNVLLTYQPAR